MALQQPYLLFLGDAPDALAAKVAQGIKDWRPDASVGQIRLDGCNADMGLRDMSVAEAARPSIPTTSTGTSESAQLQPILPEPASPMQRTAPSPNRTHAVELRAIATSTAPVNPGICTNRSNATSLGGNWPNTKADRPAHQSSPASTRQAVWS